LPVYVALCGINMDIVLSKTMYPAIDPPKTGAILDCECPKP
jgi:hypothetical protein